MLALDVEAHGVSYLAADGRGGLSSGSIGFAAGQGDGWRQAVEDAVYSTPPLLEERDRVVIAVHAPHFALLPCQVVDAGLARRVMEASFTSLDGDLLVQEIAGSDAAVAMDVPGGLLGFLRRTFAGAVLLPHLVPLCSYCVKAYAEDTGCMHIALSQSEAHIVVVHSGKLMMANTFAFKALEDVAYYALNMWKACSLESRRDRVLLSGANELRMPLAEQLRQWIASVMPAMLPPEALRLGREAVKLPFNLITLALYD